MASFKEEYNLEMKKKVAEALGSKNLMSVPRIVKVVVNVGAGEAVSNKNVLTHVVVQLTVITGQKPVITKARKSISAFKLRKGLPLGAKVTLRGKRMFDFIEKVIRIVIPRIKDFRGISDSTVDGHGNLNIGFPEQTIFHEIDFDKIDKIRGLEVTIVTTAKSHERGVKFFEVLGVAFKK